MTTQLPFELLALIIDFVAADAFNHDKKAPDTTDLRQCALVSPQIAIYCQQHLFSRIEIALDKPRALSNLRHILEIDHPEIGPYIKVLSVIFCLSRDATFHGLDGILKTCTQVTELNIRSLPFGNDPVVIRRDSELPDNVRLALESILYSPTCKTFSFDGLAMPISMFATPHRSCTLESLTLTQGGFYQEQNGVLVEGSSYSSLRFLSLPTSRIRDLLPHKFWNSQYVLDFTGLATLWVNHKYSRTEPKVIAEMLRRAPRLQALGIILRSYPPGLLRTIFSTPAHCLSTTLVEVRLNLLSEWRFLPMPNKDPFAGELAGFRALSGMNVLRMVYIELVLDKMWWQGEIFPESWLPAATIFADPGSFPFLKEFTVEVLAPEMILSVDEYETHTFVSGERLVNGLLKVPFHALELPYSFNFSVRAV